MKIVVLGNSNSILRDGWLPAFLAADPSKEIVNLSLGGSRSPAMLYQVLDNLDSFSVGDLVIVEPTVLDCGEKAGTGDDVAGQAKALLRVLLNMGVIPILLVLPRIPRHVDEPSPGMLAWASIAASLGVSVYDGADIIKRFAKNLNRRNEEFWRDDHGHHVPAAGRLIGIGLSRFLAEQDIASGAIPAAASGEAASDWRVLLGAELAAGGGLSSRKSSTALVSVECVVMGSGDSLHCNLAADEKLLGLAINYGEMDPTKDTFIEVRGKSGSRRMNVSHSLLPAMIAHKARVIFRATNFPFGFGDISLPDCPENARFSAAFEERLEISGVLVGKEISPITGWRELGYEALKGSHGSAAAFIGELAEENSPLLSL